MLYRTNSVFQSGDYFLNLSYDCLDANLLKGQQNCRFLWQGRDELTRTSMDVHKATVAVNKCANVLKGLGGEKGCRVLVNMPALAQLPVAVLACARIGAQLTYVVIDVF